MARPVYAKRDTYHRTRTCRRLHTERGRINRVDDTEGMTACPVCLPDDGDDDAEDGAGGGTAGTCEAKKTDGEVCGRERPCPYHDKR